jgi:hypothetical protein
MHATELSERLKEVFINGRWIANTNYRELLSDVTCEVATTKFGNLNTIAALVFHVNYYIDGLLRVLDGGPLEIHDKLSFKMTAVTTEQEWTILLDTFLNNAEMFIVKVAQLPDEKLSQPFVDEKYGIYQRNIEGVIEHSYYHLGQIALLKKLGEAM